MIKKQIQFECDGKPDGNTCPEFLQGTIYHNKSVHYAIEMGWDVRDEKCFCPKCVSGHLNIE